ncbi:MAG: hypothetical protein SCH39_07840 [Methanosarcinales archaeon]|nr:hypothetical protein [ANME-2 cluster archaeon]MDF1530916.1 hypothetical protein [ANME-2 cluster archaeon]MDW7776226.1 hypothetical protein [Methanosarcinales archaeon]
MNKAVFFTIILILLFPSAAAQTIKTIEVHENGTAFLTIEERIPLKTQPELNEWNQFTRNGQGFRYQKVIQELEDKTNQSLILAKNYTNRSMEVRNVNISYDMLKTTSGTFGIIIFHFEWVNFASLDSSSIFIGDSFTEVMVPSSDNVLIIKIPDDYDILSVSPEFDKRDGTRLIWDGTMYRSFNVGEPALVLKPGTNTWPFMLLVLIIIISGLTILFLKKRFFTGAKDDTVFSPDQDLKMEFIEDEEMIIKILITHNGQANQSDIVRESGFSKSKISNILAKMKEDGDIEKIRKGKRNIIRIKNN